MKNLVKAKYSRMDFILDLCDLFKLPEGTIWADIHMSAVDNVLVSCEYEIQTSSGNPAIEGEGLDAKIKTMKKKYKVKLEEIEEGE